MAKKREPGSKYGRPPEWKLTALDKETEESGQIGVGWDEEDGSITIKLNMNIVLDTRTQKLAIRLWPRDEAHWKNRETNHETTEPE